ncbi:MAG: hypothetical protein KatS3mg131_1370 [Candidatus Tectimicrobiota bacterium]|nr:MAG: hypothetical protein KatS3mg131_1370 [Candidatus Tectomicrobia bacterium]
MDRTVSCLVSLALVLLTTAALAAPPPAVTPALLAQGKALYEKQCAVCHGTEGKGNGPAADFLFPKPRDFTSGVFKLRSTPLGEPPTDADLFRTLTRGLPGSAMPGFAFLSETERWALVAYVKQLASIKVPPEEVVAIPPETPATLASIERGRKIYFEAGCDQCHGPEGRGDGPQAKELEDDWGTPIFPANLPLARFKGGGTPQDLYRTLATGVDGTPMPAVEGLPPEQIWDLVHYVRYLTGGKIVKQPDGTAMLEAKRLQGPLPAQPLDPRWETVPATTIPLMDLWQFPDKPLEAVTVRAAHDGASLVLLLTWKDYSAAPDALRHQDFADGAAVQWSLTPEPPHFTMGEPGHPVNIWFWRYDFQRDLAEHQDLEHVYPGMAVDWYPYQRAKAGVVGPTGRAGSHVYHRLGGRQPDVPGLSPQCGAGPQRYALWLPHGAAAVPAGCLRNGHLGRRRVAGGLSPQPAHRGQKRHAAHPWHHGASGVCHL